MRYKTGRICLLPTAHKPQFISCKPEPVNGQSEKNTGQRFKNLQEPDKSRRPQFARFERKKIPLFFPLLFILRCRAKIAFATMTVSPGALPGGGERRNFM
jgi:hypothetical protein